MPKVTFLPAGVSVKTEPGVTLLDAARLAGVPIAIPCGGQGTCGRCKTIVVSGTLNAISGADARLEEAGAGAVLACRCSVADADVTIEIPKQRVVTPEVYVEPLPDNPILDGIASSPVTILRRFTVPAPELDDGRSDDDRFSETFRKETGVAGVELPLALLRALPVALRNAGGVVDAVFSVEGETATVHRLAAGVGLRNWVVALDLGTTTVSALLLDADTGKGIDCRGTYNDQVACGEDVIGRINYAATPGRLADLRERALASINRVLNALCDGAGIEPRDINAAWLSGNTVMTHLLLGVIPEYIRLEPYTPAFMLPRPLRAAELGIDINPDGLVRFSPAVGSYVGGDITAGLLCTGLVPGSDGIELFIDIGTNGELVLGNRDFLIACACSAGPAFEGGGVEWGMHAAPGAIDRIAIDPGTGRASYEVIGGGKPRGICGSALIGALAGYFRGGWIDAGGKVREDRDTAAGFTRGRRRGFIIAPAQETAAGVPLTISEVDIENLLRAKAAVYAATALVLGHVGVAWQDISRLHVAGGFGRFINIGDAVTLGLFPDLPADRFSYAGNTSLRGSARALLARAERDLLAETARRITYINLTNESRYMDEFMAALFIPHTDASRFPSAGKG